MGSKHPISLKLKQFLNWNSTIYKFNLKDLSEIVHKEIVLSVLLKHYFQSILISKPIYHHYINSLSIIIYFYSKTKSKKYIYDKQSKFKLKKKNNFFNNNQINKKIIPWKKNRLKKLETILTIINGKKVKLKLIKLKSPICNSSILAQYISINIAKYNINTLWKKILKKFKLVNLKYYNTSITFNWNNLINNSYLFLYKKFISYITGIKLKISGRFSRRKGASRTKINNFSIGSFRFNSISSYIDYNLISSKNKNGSQSIKVFTATTFYKNI
jgi:hypothetical protein